MRPLLGGLISISKNVQTVRFSTLDELQCRDHAQKLPFEILLGKLVHMSVFMSNLGLTLATSFFLCELLISSL